LSPTPAVIGLPPRLDRRPAWPERTGQPDQAVTLSGQVDLPVAWTTTIRLEDHP
jgi:hypothetical protein